MSEGDSGVGTSDEFHVAAKTQGNDSSKYQHDTSDSDYGTGNIGESVMSMKQSDRLQYKVLKACEEGELALVKQIAAEKKIILTMCNKDREAHGDSLLHVAAFFGHKKIVQYLMEKENFEVDLRNNYKNTPLHRAANQGHIQVVKYLIEEKKSDPMAKCHWGRTPLHNACRHGRFQVVEYLLSIESVDPLAKDTLFQHTPLQLAAKCRTKDVVQYMIEWGVDIARTDRVQIYSTTPCSIWRKGRHC